jgi:hypothetical protein
VRLTLISQNKSVLNLVGDFASGLGCTVDRRHLASDGLRVELPDERDALLELLDYIALSATKAGIDPAEPLCRLQYRRRGATAQVRLDLRIGSIGLDD